MKIEVPISVGELLDKITILEIKRQHGLDTNLELDKLKDIAEKCNLPDRIGQDLKYILKSINMACWNVEEGKRSKEIDGLFDEEFVQLARCVYMFNDERARVKKIIDKLTDSEITEHKSHRTN